VRLSSKWRKNGMNSRISDQTKMCWTKTFYHRVIQVKIGQELRAQYELPQEPAHRILTLLAQLNARHDEESGATVGNGQSKAR
jgi:hypothetical protein